MRQAREYRAFFIAKIAKIRPSHTKGFEGQIGPKAPKITFRCEHT